MKRNHFRKIMRFVLFSCTFSQQYLSPGLSLASFVARRWGCHTHLPLCTGPHLCRASGALFVVSVSGHWLLHHVWPFSSQFHSPARKWDTVRSQVSQIKKEQWGSERNRERNRDRSPQSSWSLLIIKVFCTSKIWSPAQSLPSLQAAPSS